MEASDSIEAYVRRVRQEFRWNPLLARRVLEEVMDHLAEIAAEERGTGMSQKEAEASAVRRFGPAEQFRRQFHQMALPFRIILFFASMATTCVVLWLFWVIAFVLPARDPAHIGVWRIVALGSALYVGLSWAYLVLGPRPAFLRWLMTMLSVLAVGFGLYGITGMILRTMAGGHFEGYIVLMGLILCGHGASCVLYTVLARRISRQFNQGSPAGL